MPSLRILFVGHSWHGSNARSFREALAAQPGVVISDVGEDQFVPIYRTLPMRFANRVLRKLQERELSGAVQNAVSGFQPDVVVVYKGDGIGRKLIECVRQGGIPLVNIFPDITPLPRDHELRASLGRYDVVYTTKYFHPEIWKPVHGYENPCVFVPHGYDAGIHYRSEPAPADRYDVAICATWRPEYHRVMQSFAAALGDRKITVALGGPGWAKHAADLPSSWEVVGSRNGTAYVDFLRSARVVIAPVTREASMGGRGDEDTARSYELAAAHCFFVHRRTEYIATVYDEHREVPLWSDGEELARLVERWLPDAEGRQRLANAAHARAVPAYSIAHRAATVLEHLKQFLDARADRSQHTLAG